MSNDQNLPTIRPGDPMPAPASRPSGLVPAINAKELLARRAAIKEIRDKIMIRDIHFGSIPGVKGDVLLKPGADVLLSTFQIATKIEIVDLETVRDDGEVTIRVVCTGVLIGTETVVGQGVGECSTRETKYRWRAAVGKEYENAKNNGDEHRIHYKPKGQGKSGVWENEQVRMEPGNMGNTILKMATKRAVASFCHAALDVGDLFVTEEQARAQAAQDQRNNNQRPARQPAPPTADMPESVAEHIGEPRGAPPPAPDAPINDRQVGILISSLDAAGVEEQLLLDSFGVQSLSELPFSEINKALQWIHDNKTQ